jgi:hypothetical protein
MIKSIIGMEHHHHHHHHHHGSKRYSIIQWKMEMIVYHLTVSLINGLRQSMVWVLLIDPPSIDAFIIMFIALVSLIHVRY